MWLSRVHIYMGVCVGMQRQVVYVVVVFVCMFVYTRRWFVSCKYVFGSRVSALFFSLRLVRNRPQIAVMKCVAIPVISYHSCMQLCRTIIDNVIISHLCYPCSEYAYTVHERGLARSAKFFWLCACVSQVW